MKGTLRITVVSSDTTGAVLAVDAVDPSGNQLASWGPFTVTPGQAICVDPCCLECDLATTCGPCDVEAFHKATGKTAPGKPAPGKPAAHPGAGPR